MNHVGGRRHLYPRASRLAPSPLLSYSSLDTSYGWEDFYIPTRKPMLSRLMESPLRRSDPGNIHCLGRSPLSSPRYSGYNGYNGYSTSFGSSLSPTSYSPSPLASPLLGRKDYELPPSPSYRRPAVFVYPRDFSYRPIVRQDRPILIDHRPPVSSSPALYGIQRGRQVIKFKEASLEPKRKVSWQLTTPTSSPLVTRKRLADKTALDDSLKEALIKKKIAEELSAIKENKDRIRFKKYQTEDFNFLKVIGKGSFGKVLLAELKGTSRYFAVKCVSKPAVLEDDDVECTIIERKVLALGTQHPFLCKLFCTFQTPSHLFFVMEYLSGGDLLFHIQKEKFFAEQRARFYVAELVCALKFLHRKGIVYRDLKMDNIVLDSEGHAKLVDFGMCQLKIYREECLPSNFCGTPHYMSPELLKGQQYNQSVDWWALGVVTYEMILGQSPFNGTDEDELFWVICNEEPKYPVILSSEALQFLKALLMKAPEERLGMPDCEAGEISEIRFLSPINWEKLEQRRMEPPFKPNSNGPEDVCNFDSHFTKLDIKFTIDDDEVQNIDQELFRGFSYTNPNMAGD